MSFTSQEAPKRPHPYRYQIGFLFLEAYGRQFIYWRTVSQRRFLRRYYAWVDRRAVVEDILAVFHAGDIQRFKREVFRALPI